MSDPLPFNSLGQILTTGSEIPVARQSGAGIAGAVLLGFIRKRFPSLNPLDLEPLSQIAADAAAGGAGLLTGVTDPSDIIPLERLPAQPLLPSDILQGSDAIIEATIETEGVRAMKAMLRLSFGDTLGDLIDQALDEVLRRIGESPDRFSDGETATGALQGIVVQWGERGA